VSHAKGRRSGGSPSTGKNVPEKMNSGVMTNRKIAAKRSGVRWVAEKAAIGAAKARPVSTATGMANTTSGDSAAPKSTITAVNTVEIMSRRAAIQSRLPRAMSRLRSGVAYMAWNVRFQTSPPMIGNVDSKEPACIAVATRRPGARNAMYGTPPSAPWVST
jgi:hypothetical protein